MWSRQWARNQSSGGGGGGSSDHGSLTGLSDDDHSQYVPVSGARPSATKSTPVDADAVLLSDSAASNGLKKLSWSNIKATMKTYMDTLYVALSGNQTVAGIKTFSSFPVTPSSDPTADYEVANKKYVDDNAGGGGSGGTETLIEAKDITAASGVSAIDIDLTKGETYRLEIEKIISTSTDALDLLARWLEDDGMGGTTENSEAHYTMIGVYRSVHGGSTNGDFNARTQTEATICKNAAGSSQNPCSLLTCTIYTGDASANPMIRTIATTRINQISANDGYNSLNVVSASHLNVDMDIIGVRLYLTENITRFKYRLYKQTKPTYTEVTL